MVWSSYHAWQHASHIMHHAFCVPHAINAHTLRAPSLIAKESLVQILRFSLSVAVLWVKYISCTQVLLQSAPSYLVPPFYLCSRASPFNVICRLKTAIIRITMTLHDIWVHCIICRLKTMIRRITMTLYNIWVHHVVHRPKTTITRMTIVIRTSAVGMAPIHFSPHF